MCALQVTEVSNSHEPSPHINAHGAIEFQVTQKCMSMGLYMSLCFTWQAREKPAFECMGGHGGNASDAAMHRDATRRCSSTELGLASRTVLSSVTLKFSVPRSLSRVLPNPCTGSSKLQCYGARSL